jgi:UDP-glucuronate decarboxylase
MIKDSSIIIAGGAGFIGHHLCNALVGHGNEITVIDDFSTGTLANISELLKQDGFEVLKGDICDDIDEFADYTFNLACPASPVYYQREPFNTLMTSVQGTWNLLNNAATTNGVFVQASTSEVYGDPLEHPQKEGYWGNVNTLGPRACYDEGKRAAETLCADFNRNYEMDIRIARIFNTYGPNMRPNDGRVVSNFIMSALLGKPLTVFGDGSQTRSLCYVSDTVDALIRMASRKLDFTVLNIGNPDEITMLELAEKIIKKTNSQSKIAFFDLPEDDPKRRKPDITAAKETIKWKPKVSLDDGLDMTIEYFRKISSWFQ